MIIQMVSELLNNYANASKKLAFINPITPLAMDKETITFDYVLKPSLNVCKKFYKTVLANTGMSNGKMKPNS